MSTNKKFRIQNGADIVGELSINDVTVIGADGKVVEGAVADAVASLTAADIADLQSQVTAILGTSPETLDTLQEIVTAFQDADTNLVASVASNSSDIATINATLTSGVATTAQGAKAETAVQPEDFFTVADGTTTSYVADWSQPMGVESTLTPTGVSNRAKYIVDLSKSVDGKTIAIYGTRKGEWVGGYLNNDNDAVQHWAVAWDENGNHIHTYDMGVDTLPDNIHLGHDAKRYVSADITDTHIFIASGSWGGYRAYEISDPTVLVASSNLSMSISTNSMKARIRVIDDKIISTSSGSQYYTGNFQVRTWADGNLVSGTHLTWNGNAGEWQADKETGWVYIADTQGQAKGYNFKTMTSGATIPNGAKSIGVGNKYMVTSDGDTYNEIIDAKVYLVGTNTEVATLVRPNNVFFWGANPIMYQGNNASYGEAVILTGRPQNTNQNTHYVFDMSSANPSTHVKTISGNGQWEPNLLQINSKHSVQKTIGAVQSYSGEPTTATVTNILGPVTEVVTPNVDASTIASKVYVDESVNEVQTEVDALTVAVATAKSEAISTASADAASKANAAEAGAKAYAEVYADQVVAATVDAAPAALDTLNELAAALGDDANFASTVTTSLASKADDAATTAALATKSDQTDLDTLETFVKGSANRGSERLNSIRSGQWDFERSGGVTNNGALTVFSRQGGESLVARKEISGLQVGKTYQIRTSGEAGGNIYVALNTVGQSTYSGHASSNTKVPFIGTDIHNHDVANGLNQYGSNGTSTGDVLTDLGTSFIAPATSLKLHVIASDMNPADHNIYDISVTEYEPAPTLETSSSTILESVNELHTEIDALTVAVASTADSTAVVDAIATSKSEAIATASADATAKADQAETDAKAYADQVVAATVDAAPAALDTLNELAAALGDDANFASTVTASIATKADDAATTAALATKASQDDLTAETTRATSAETINNQAIAILQNQVSGISTSSGSSTIEMTAEVDMSSNKITDMADPTAAQDAATKAYVDSGVAGVDLSGYTDTSGMTSAIATAKSEAISTASADATVKADQAEADAKAYADQVVAATVDAAPAALDTLNELAAALGDDANFSATVTASISTKADEGATNAALATKADDAATTAALATKATVVDVNVIDNFIRGSSTNTQIDSGLTEAGGGVIPFGFITSLGNGLLVKHSSASYIKDIPSGNWEFSYYMMGSSIFETTMYMFSNSVDFNSGSVESIISSNTPLATFSSPEGFHTWSFSTSEIGQFVIVPRLKPQYTSDSGWDGMRLVMDQRGEMASRDYAGFMPVSPSLATTATEVIPAINELQTELNALSSTQSGDQSNLQSQITAEVARASSAEAVNAANIVSETSARSSADAALQSDIVGLQNQVGTIISGSPASLDTLVEIVSAFETADASLSGVITANGGRLTTAENNITALGADITAEESARGSADATLQANIDAEAVTRSNLGSQLLGYINTNGAAITAGDNANSAEVATEKSRAEGAEATLQSNIDALTSSTGGDVSGLQSSIDAEEAARIAADSALQSSIDAEESRATTAEAGLQSQISNVLSNTDATALNSLAEIVAEFQSADSTLTSAVAGHGTRLTSLESSTSAILAWDTDNLSEGTTNKFWTPERSKSALTGGLCITYNSSTGEIKIDEAEVATDLHVASSSDANELGGQAPSHYRINVYDVNGTIVN